MSRSADVGIVGAGPAGARAAELLARHGARVAVLDSKVPWEKPCGGGLTWSAFEEIPELVEIRPTARRIERMRIELGPDHGFWVPLDHPLWIVSREVLGRWQLERALDAGAEHHPVKVRSIERSGGRWVLEADGGALSCSFLVGADGAASLVRRVAAPGFSVELAPTRVAYPPMMGSAPETVVLKFYEGIAGYLWDFPRPHHRSIGVGVPNGTWRRPALDAEIDGYRRSSEPCSCVELPRAGAVIGTAELGHGDFASVGGPDFALLGDAAGFADPLTGEGIQNAMRSAGLLARAWTSGTVEAYPTLARRAFAREFAAARTIRRHVFERPVGVRWIEGAVRSPVLYAGIAAVVNAMNEHDGSTRAIVRRFVSGWRRLRRDPGPTAVEGREPVPCCCADAGAGGGEDAGAACVDGGAAGEATHHRHMAVPVGSRWRGRRRPRA